MFLVGQKSLIEPPNISYPNVCRLWMWTVYCRVQYTGICVYQIPVGENGLHSCLGCSHVIWEEYPNRIWPHHYFLASCAQTLSVIVTQSLAMSAGQGDFILLTPSSMMKSKERKNENTKLVVRIRVSASQKWEIKEEWLHLDLDISCKFRWYADIVGHTTNYASYMNIFGQQSKDALTSWSLILLHIFFRQRDIRPRRIYMLCSFLQSIILLTHTASKSLRFTACPVS